MEDGWSERVSMGSRQSGSVCIQCSYKSGHCGDGEKWMTMVDVEVEAARDR